MLEPDLTQWNWWIYTVHGLAAFYLTFFFVSWFRFRSLDKRVQTGDLTKHQYNRKISGFPWAFYAKMLGRKKFSGGDEDVAWGE